MPVDYEDVCDQLSWVGGIEGYFSGPSGTVKILGVDHQKLKIIIMHVCIP
jgi:hypothetical protein